MGSREDLLRADIERAKEDLARDIQDLRREAAELQRKIIRAAGSVAAAYVAYRLIRLLIRRARD